MPSLTERFMDSLISCTLHPTDSWPPSKSRGLVATAEGENKVIYPCDCSSWHKLTLYTQTRLPLFQLAFGILRRALREMRLYI